MIYKLMMIAKKIRILFLIMLLALTISPTLAWTVAPVRFEIKGEKGKEYTLTFSVLNESQLYQKRFEIFTDDWTIDKNNEFLRKTYTKGFENKYSATSWIKVTPLQFVVPPGETKTIRFTVTVPKDLPVDGDYTSGIFVGEKNIEKPPKGEKIVHIKQDTFIGVVVYVKIGHEEQKTTLKAMKVKAVPDKSGKTRITILPTFVNSGNIHSRGQITVKAEPVEASEEKDELVQEFNAGEVVVLRESEVTFPIDLPTLLSGKTEWKFTLKTDFGENESILVGTKKFKVPMKQEAKARNDGDSENTKKRVTGEIEKEKS